MDQERAADDVPPKGTPIGRLAQLAYEGNAAAAARLRQRGLARTFADACQRGDTVAAQLIYEAFEQSHRNLADMIARELRRRNQIAGATILAVMLAGTEKFRYEWRRLFSGPAETPPGSAAPSPKFYAYVDWRAGAPPIRVLLERIAAVPGYLGELGEHKHKIARAKDRAAYRDWLYSGDAPATVVPLIYTWLGIAPPAPGSRTKPARDARAARPEAMSAD